MIVIVSGVDYNKRHHVAHACVRTETSMLTRCTSRELRCLVSLHHRSNLRCRVVARSFCPAVTGAGDEPPLSHSVTQAMVGIKWQHHQQHRPPLLSNTYRDEFDLMAKGLGTRESPPLDEDAMADAKLQLCCLLDDAVDSKTMRALNAVCIRNNRCRGSSCTQFQARSCCCFVSSSGACTSCYCIGNYPLGHYCSVISSVVHSQQSNSHQGTAV